MKLDAIKLLLRLISTPSFSREENATATIIEQSLQEVGIATNRLHNNIWSINASFDASKPTLLLNSHHDTVKPSSSYTLDPFSPLQKGGRIYGLGSNDAGASVVSLAYVFSELYDEVLPVNLILALTAEEEVSGKNGIEALLNHLKDKKITIDMAIVGEPTKMQAAVAERGLVVLDCSAHGRRGHAARNEGDNAILHAIEDINRLSNFSFDKVSGTLGDIKMSVTQINAGTQHNVIPDQCEFVVDIRTTDAYTNEEIVDIISSALTSEVKPRSTRLRASVISHDHPLVKAACRLGIPTIISPTMSDRALMHGIPALKIGPGDSARSHSADEYVEELEIFEAIEIYKNVIRQL